MINQAPGPLMLDLVGTSLSPAERSLLARPMVGGVILFSRNFQDVAQLCELVASIRQVRPELLIAVDHEGGRVQRFRQGFTRLPPMGRIGELWQRDPAAAEALARQCGWLLASELLAVGIDFSFAPVLDREIGRSRVIGDRSFGDNAAQIEALATALIDGMHSAGMKTTGKHFPGHGYVVADSHVDIPRDSRDPDQIRSEDMSVFAALIRAQKLDAIMPAHVIYEQVDMAPAGFSSIWLQAILRNQLGFQGVIFSDDLSMEGAGVAGGFVERAQAALGAGCDMVLVCNRPDGALQVLDYLEQHPSQPNARLATLRGHAGQSWEQLQADAAYQDCRQQVERFVNL